MATRLDYLWILLLSAVLISGNLAWCASDGRPPRQDDNYQLLNSLDFDREVRAPEPLAEKMAHLLLWQTNPRYGGGGYPPLVYAVTSLMYTCFGRSQRSAIMALQWFVPLLLLSCYGLGCRFGGRLGGWAAVALVAASQNVAMCSRQYFLELPCTALVAACYWSLLTCDGFTRRAPSLLFGMLLGLTMLTKWVAAAVLLPPLLYYALRRPSPDWRNLAWALGVTVLICGSWYASTWPRLHARLVVEAGVRESYAGTLWLRQTINVCALLPFLPLMAAIGAMKAWRERSQHLPTVLAVGVGWLAFAGAGPKDQRYVLALAPFFAILSSFWLRGRGGAAVLAVLLTLTVYQAWGWSLPASWYPVGVPTAWDHPTTISGMLLAPRPQDRLSDFAWVLKKLAAFSNQQRPLAVCVGISVEKRGYFPPALMLQTQADFENLPLWFLDAAIIEGQPQMDDDLSRLLAQRQPLMLLLASHDLQPDAWSREREQWTRYFAPYRLRLSDTPEFELRGIPDKHGTDFSLYVCRTDYH